MKILMLTDLYPPHYRGGYELACEQVTGGLIQRGHDVTVLTTTFGVGEPQVNGNVIRRMHYLVAEAKSRVGRRLDHARFAQGAAHNYRQTRQAIDQVQPDLVVSWNLESTSILPILAAQDAGLPNIFTLNSHWLIWAKLEYQDESSRLRRIYRRGLLNFRRFEELRFKNAILLTPSLQRSYEEHGLVFDRATTAPRGVPDDQLATPFVPRQRTPDEPLRLVFAGRLEEPKGPDIAVEAVLQLVQAGYKNLELDMFGKGQPDYLAGLTAQIEQAGLTKHVRLAGFMPQDELIQRYKTYDALLFTTRQWEGLGMVTLEAMSQGTPIIASAIGGPTDVILDGKTGMLFTPGDASALAEAIKQLLDDPSLRDTLGQAAFDHVRTNFTTEKMVTAHETFYAACLEGELPA